MLDIQPQEAILGTRQTAQKQRFKWVRWPLILLLAGIAIGLAILFLLDKALISHAVGKRNSVDLTNSSRQTATTNRSTNIFEVLPGNSRSVLNDSLKNGQLNPGDINPMQAREALRNAPTSAIQNAIQTKTGKTLSADKIETARRKALSSDGQRKINQALKNRDQIDLSKIREKLGR